MRIIGLDVGEKRIGVARASSDTKIAVPIGYINVDGLEWQEIAQVANINNTNLFVLGLPRSNDGNETAQSMYVRNFARALIEQIPGARVRFQDESYTSVVAEERLKAKKKKYEKGDIDSEAAAIILQDFLENLKNNNEQSTLGPTDEIQDESNRENEPSKIREAMAEAGETVTNLTKKEADKVMLKTKKARHRIKGTIGIIVSIILLVLVISGIGVGVWAKTMLDPVTSDCAKTECSEKQFVVSEGESKSTIADNLEKAGLIKSAFVFKAYQRLFKSDVGFKSGTYYLSDGQSVDEIIAELEKGPSNDHVFSFTIRPGETIFEIKDNLASLGYSEAEIEKAFKANYDFDFLRDRPSEATLEGYLFGETHEFYKNTPVEEIIKEYLSGTQKVISENNLESKYAEQGLSLFEGITLASVVQMESPTDEMPTVAQVFLSRLNSGTPLGSDVTVSYALDVVDPTRSTYTDNASALTIDSCYNTRLYSGLPCGPISNPGLNALLSVAEPSDTAYLYFLTGDDGLMYYSYTEDEHIQNIYSHCQKLCNVSL